MIAGAVTIVLLFGILPLFLPRVDVLPYGLDPVLTQFMDKINTIIAILPFMSTVWNVFIIALTVKFTLLSFNWAYRFIKLIRGGG